MSKEWLRNLASETAERHDMERLAKEWQLMEHGKVQSGAPALWKGLTAEVDRDVAQFNLEFKRQGKSLTLRHHASAVEIAADFFPTSIVRATLGVGKIEVELNEGALGAGIFKHEPPLDIRLGEDGEIHFKHGDSWLGIGGASQYIISKLTVCL